MPDIQVPKDEEDEFVPEEEEEGPNTQGDGLMMAKAKRQSSGLTPTPSPVTSPVATNPPTSKK